MKTSYICTAYFKGEDGRGTCDTGCQWWVKGGCPAAKGSKNWDGRESAIIRDFTEDKTPQKGEKTTKKASRQIRWQHKKQEQGLCIRCGKEPLVTSRFCKSCNEKNKEEQRRYFKDWRKKHPDYFTERSEAWRKKHPNYFKDYYHRKKREKMTDSTKCEKCGEKLSCGDHITRKKLAGDLSEVVVDVKCLNCGEEMELTYSFEYLATK